MVRATPLGEEKGTQPIVFGTGVSDKNITVHNCAFVASRTTFRHGTPEVGQFQAGDS